MNIKEILNSTDGSKHFSFEVLPPLKGTGTERLFSTIEKFKEFNPAYINITTHHSEYVYREVEGGQYERLRLRRRPGTVAIAAAIQNKFGIPVIPHVKCLLPSPCCCCVATRPRKTADICLRQAATRTRQS